MGPHTQGVCIGTLNMLTAFASCGSLSALFVVLQILGEMASGGLHYFMPPKRASAW